MPTCSRGPDINLARVPTNRREFGGYSDDPEPVSQMSVAFITGVEQPGLITESKQLARTTRRVSRQRDHAHVAAWVLQGSGCEGSKRM